MVSLKKGSPDQPTFYLATDFNTKKRFMTVNQIPQ
jgi:hypothetical protein